ncbi:MAG: outer membrane beta-barrel protein [Planctomycetes bacterium]|nr:outer membrane beta-barrel protein [Planctomycetota bacterium]
MRWFLRSAVAAAGLGSAAPVALGQYESPPPMMPPVRPLPDDEPPPSGITKSLIVPAPAPALPALPIAPAAATVPLPAIPVPATAPAPPPVPPATVEVSPVSPAKPAPTVAVQAAIPAYPPAGPQSPIRQTRSDESPTERPDRLPPVLPIAPPTAPPAAPPKPPAKLTENGFPLPPAGAKLPSIQVSPRVTPGASAPRTATKPVELPPFPSTSTGKPATATPAPAPIPGALAALATSAAAAGAALPESPCPTTRVCDIGCDPVWRACPQDGPVRVRGWLDGGYVYNTSNPNSKFNGPYNSIDRNAEPMFNQAYLIVDRPLPADGSFGAGFRIDALFGYDFFLGQSRGFEVDRDFNRRWNGQYYGLAIPQAYLEAGTDRVSLKLGHFYTTVGYEMLPATGNFFYSHAYSYQFGQPFTHWGGLLTAKIGRNWEAHAGLVNGWDALVGRANNVNVLAGLKYTADSRLWWSSFALVSGQEQNNVAGLPGVIGTDGNRTRYSFLFGLTPGGLCGRWEYVFHHYYGFQENATAQMNFARWYGIDQYLYYRVSNNLKLGTRFEWFRDEDGTRVGLMNRSSNPNNPPLPGNYFSLTGGLNYAPTANVMIRPEIRWDFTSDTSRRAFDDGRKNNQLLLGCDLVWQF